MWARPLPARCWSGSAAALSKADGALPLNEGKLCTVLSTGRGFRGSLPEGRPVGPGDGIPAVQEMSTPGMKAAVRGWVFSVGPQLCTRWGSFMWTIGCARAQDDELPTKVVCLSRVRGYPQAKLVIHTRGYFSTVAHRWGNLCGQSGLAVLCQQAFSTGLRFWRQLADQSRQQVFGGGFGLVRALLTGGGQTLSTPWITRDHGPWIFAWTKGRFLGADCGKLGVISGKLGTTLLALLRLSTVHSRTSQIHPPNFDRRSEP